MLFLVLVHTISLNYLKHNLQFFVITARKRSLGQGNMFTPVCHSVHRGGVHDQVPPGTRYTPPCDQVHPLPDQVHPAWDQVHPPGPVRYGLRAGGTHPTGMQSCGSKSFHVGCG